jgi:hypothetical protein
MKTNHCKGGDGKSSRIAPHLHINHHRGTREHVATQAILDLAVHRANLRLQLTSIFQALHTWLVDCEVGTSRLRLQALRAGWSMHRSQESIRTAHPTSRLSVEPQAGVEQKAGRERKQAWRPMPTAAAAPSSGLMGEQPAPAWASAQLAEGLA